MIDERCAKREYRARCSICGWQGPWVDKPTASTWMIMHNNENPNCGDRK